MRDPRRRIAKVSQLLGGLFELVHARLQRRFVSL
jgi:hypothetical protein